MRYVSLRLPEGIVPGVVDADEIVLLSPLFADLVAVIEGGVAAREAVGALVRERSSRRVPLAGAALAPPITRFRRDVLCTGWNYWDHFEEGRAARPAQERPKAPTFFTKGPDAVIGPHDDIAVDPAISPTWDYEAELALVFGRAGRSIPATQALDHVFGYCLANDVSQRDLQRRHGGQWMKGKSIDATTPLGPMLVTADEIDPSDLQLECAVNGQVLQRASTRQMAFAIPDLVAELSFGMTVRPGDVLLTGTPSGVGQSRQPPLFLKDGDEVVVTGEGLGALRNRVRAVDLAGASGIRLET